MSGSSGRQRRGARGAPRAPPPRRWRPSWGGWRLRRRSCTTAGRLCKQCWQPSRAVWRRGSVTFSDHTV
eukprot:4228634-Prymnesium_polylepis.1